MRGTPPFAPGGGQFGSKFIKPSRPCSLASCIDAAIARLINCRSSTLFSGRICGLLRAAFSSSRANARLSSEEFSGRTYSLRDSDISGIASVELYMLISKTCYFMHRILNFAGTSQRAQEPTDSRKIGDKKIMVQTAFIRFAIWPKLGPESCQRAVLAQRYRGIAR